MPDDPDETFVIDHLLQQRPGLSVPAVHQGDMEVRLRAPGDDAARISHNTVVTVDAMVEGVHWDQRLTPADVGWKLVAVNASDINAMGCLPSWAVMTLALPRPLDTHWVKEFAHGLGTALDTWSIDLVGGDTTASEGARMATLTLAGAGSHITGRSTARVGDDLWVSGPLGLAAAGFFLDPAPARCAQALARPTPPIGLGAALAESGIAHAMMDLSDGVSRDLKRLCSTSGVGALVDPARLPIAPEIASHKDGLSMSVAFGEDYGLLFTASPEHRDDVMLISEPWAQPTRIGVIDDNVDLGARLHGLPWPTAAFSHFGAVS